MYQLTNDLSVASSVLFSNVWLFADSKNRRFLIDTGDAAERWLLRRCLKRAGITQPGDITAVLLTHWHRDHAGNAAWLRETYGCPVICHENDAPYLEATAAPEPLTGLKAPVWARVGHLLQDLYPARCVVDETFRAGPWKWGFEIIHTPGHTPGTVMFYHRPTATLFSGDAILTGTTPFRLGEIVGLAVPEFSPHLDECHAATRQYVKIAPEIKRLCAGHGPLVEGDINAKLRALINGERQAAPLLGIVRNLVAMPQLAKQLLPRHV
ncbi:MAG: MBL fold metallo-hydrolase [Candidatus Lernaella stagnicola]|nr:MBL fold metallo-hydrolase [Candidatus Lernaella stagnicola]